MIVMNLELDNLLGFDDFKINFSYPRKIVNSTIKGEFLPNKTNFRFKKVNILLGVNASGKTTLGKAMMHIFNFITHKSPVRLLESVKDKRRKAFFSIDFLIDENIMYRINCEINLDEKDHSKSILMLEVYTAPIGKRDSYEICVRKLEQVKVKDDNKSSLDVLDSVKNLGWHFTFPDIGNTDIRIDKDVLSLDILKRVLKTLDTSITDVQKSDEVENSYVIRSRNGDIFIQNGKIIEDILSSGTKMGIDISYVISSICKGMHGFYYVDEKFTFIQTDIEQFLLGIMIDKLGPLEQLFFTSHNLDLLDMDLPVHSFTFLKKDENIEAVYPSDFIKKNDISIRNAFVNDVFGTTPDLSQLWDLGEFCDE
ncbi:MAG TPA: ATP-binding protein [Clostridia bacterium]|jgi:hypothetical protein|nr:ATP-binding protein [Clostridia bacterium]HQC68715.1 ATP-binding protein [Clostridia bacterium]